MKKYIKHDRRLTSLSAPSAVNIWLLSKVLANGDDINDMKLLKKKYEAKLTKMYGDKYNFSGTVSVVKGILNGGYASSASKSLFNAIADGIENPVLVHKV